MTGAKSSKGKSPPTYPRSERGPIRIAYDKTLTATAHLAAFSSYNSDYRSPIDDRIAELAVDDLLMLAINGRRLIETAKARHCIASVSLPSLKNGEHKSPLMSVLDKIIHHRELFLIRRRSDVISVKRTAKGLREYLDAARDNLPPIFVVKSDKGDLTLFRAADLAEAFLRVIKAVVDHCEEHDLWLDDKLLNAE